VDALAATVVIPTLEGRALASLTARLQAGATAAEIVVADNGIPRSVAEELARTGVTVATMSGNLGFGAAVNRVVERSGGDVVVVLNDDVVPGPGFVDALVRAVSEGSEMAAAVLVDGDADDPTIQGAGFELDRALTPHDYLRGLRLSRLPASIAPPLGPCGAAAAYRRSAFLEVGGFDESFFAYYEDVDLALRLREHGATCTLARDAIGVHTESSTLGYDSLRKAELVGFSRACFLRKWSHRHRPTAARALALELGAAAFLVGRHGSLRPARARVRGWRAGVRTGPGGVPPMAVGALAGARRRYVRKLTHAGRLP
jgi:GT2 family glycosyltransferase